MAAINILFILDRFQEKGYLRFRKERHRQSLISICRGVLTDLRQHENIFKSRTNDQLKIDLEQRLNRIEGLSKQTDEDTQTLADEYIGYLRDRMVDLQGFTQLLETFLGRLENSERNVSTKN